jgi:hypothetical protein
MYAESGYEQWKRRRSQEPAPPDFADRVMALLAAEKATRHERSVLAAVLLALLSSRLSKIGVCSMAVAACVFRLLHVVAIFVAR